VHSGCLRYAEGKGYEVVETIADEGYSGTSCERPGLERVLELAELEVKLVALTDTGNRIGDGVQDSFAE
jgi:DNA invertase Pin-like site-specific DNA recombinase